MKKLYVVILIYFATILCAAEGSSLLPKKSPVTFLQNNGQWQKEILFKGTSTSPVSFLKDGISFGQSKKENKNTENDDRSSFIIWNLKFVNPSEDIQVNGIHGKKSVYSYLSGNNPEKWVIHPEEFSMIKYQAVFPNIDLQFYGVENALKYDFIVHKGGNIQSIQAYYEGIQKIRINKNQELEVVTAVNSQVQKKPIAWQIINGEKIFVEVQYELINDSTFGFQAKDKFNSNYDLIIDPLFQMVWSSYTNITGGNNNINYCYSNAMDINGNVYLTGMVDGTFPITPGAYSGPGNIYPEVFVAKFSNDGTTLLYWTYLPGNSSEHGVSIAVDSLGRAYVTGVVDLNITGLTNFPSTLNAYQTIHSSGSDAFLTVLNPLGTNLDYSTFLGGSGSETGYDIALGANGIAYLTGITSIGNFPVKATNSFPTGDNDLFVAKFDINQNGANSLIYSTRIGAGSFNSVYGRSITVNDSGNAFVTGYIQYTFGSLSFPITPGVYASTFNPGQDGVMSFVVKLSATTPVTLSYSTLIAPGIANGIAVDKSTDQAVIVGSTETFTFPVTPGALQTIHSGAGGTDAFVIKLNASGSNLNYSTFIGGPNWDYGTAVVLNNIGEAFVTGLASANFPTSSGSLQPNFAGGLHDFFVVQLNASGTGYGCGGSTLVGGSDEDYTGSFVNYPAPQISIRDHGGVNDSVVVSATSHSQDFPTTPGVYGPVKVNGIADQPVFFKLTCVPAGAAPVVNLSSSDTSWCDKKAIDFFDLSTNNPTSWQWYFQGAVPDTSTAQHPVGIYYPSYGSFDVTLIACNQFGCDSITYPGFINEFQIPPAPVVTYANDTLYSTTALNYQWYDLGGPIAGQTNFYYVPVQPGTYFVVITDSLGCSVPSNYFALTGIESLQHLFQAEVIPNPFQQQVTITCYALQPGSMELSVVDVMGRTVKNLLSELSSVGKNDMVMDLTELKSGIYFCTIKVNESIQIVKLVKN